MPARGINCGIPPATRMPAPMTRLAPFLALTCLLAASAAQARVIRIEILRAEPFAADQAFGNVGADPSRVPACPIRAQSIRGNDGSGVSTSVNCPMKSAPSA
jgi:hypothetical protein